MRQVEFPRESGWFAFKGLCQVGKNRYRQYETIFLVEYAPYNKCLAVRTSHNRIIKVQEFKGQWWQIDLPWEGNDE